MAGLLALSAQAAQVSYNSPSPITSTRNNVDFNVKQFDSSLGNLTGVSISIAAVQDVTIDLTNVGSADTFRVGISNGHVYLNDGISLGDSARVFDESYIMDTDSTRRIVAHTAASVGNVYGAEGAYVGNGTIAVSAIFSGSFNITEGLNDDGDGLLRRTTASSVTWSVTYTYDVVPEPTSLSLLALGAMAVGLRRRFKKAA